MNKKDRKFQKEILKIQALYAPLFTFISITLGIMVSLAVFIMNQMTILGEINPTPLLIIFLPICGLIAAYAYFYYDLWKRIQELDEETD